MIYSPLRETLLNSSPNILLFTCHMQKPEMISPYIFSHALYHVQEINLLCGSIGVGILEVDRYVDPKSLLWKYASVKAISQLERARADGWSQYAFRGAMCHKTKEVESSKYGLLWPVVDGLKMDCVFF